MHLRVAMESEILDKWYPEVKKTIIDEDEENFFIEASYKGHQFRYLQNKDGTPPFPFNPTVMIDKMAKNYAKSDEDKEYY